MQTLMEHLPSELTCVLRLSAATLIVFSSSDGNPSSKGKILLCAVEFHDTPQRPKMFFLTGIPQKSSSFHISPREWKPKLCVYYEAQKHHVLSSIYDTVSVLHIQVL